MDTIDIDLIRTGRWTDPLRTAQLTAHDLTVAQEMGLIEAVIIRPIEGLHNEYEIIGSQKTWLLAMQLQQSTVPVTKLTDTSEAMLDECYLQSNHWIDEAHNIQKIVEENKLSLAEIGRRLNKPRSEICNLMRILQIHPSILDSIRAHPAVKKGHAKVLAGLQPQDQKQLLGEIIKTRLSVQKTEALAKSLRLKTKTPNHDTSKKSADILRLENLLADHLSAETVIDLENHQLNINYQGDFDILEGILEKIGVQMDA